MVQVKRNSQEFKLVKELLDEYAPKKTRKKLIRLYAMKPSPDLEEMTLINDLKKDGDVVYDLTYESIQDYLRDRNKKLFRKEKEPFYVFKNSAKTLWMEFPFEFGGKLKKLIFPLRVVK